MTADGFPLPLATSPRPPWLVTLADLALLLVGFLLLVQALGRDDPARLAAAVRAGFGGEAAQPVATAGMVGFAEGSAALPREPTAVIAWARDALADPRTLITVTGEAGATPADVDPASGSAALLATDRARALAAALIVGGVSPARIAIAPRTGAAAQRTAVAALSFAR